MNEPIRSQDALLSAPTRRWPQILMMVGIFVSGGIVGGAISRMVVREQMLSALRDPSDVPDRIIPSISRTLGLSSSQQADVDVIVRRHHAAMETLRAETYPRQMAEFQAMCSEVDVLLTADQRSKWTALTKFIRSRYLPNAPAGPPPATFLFETFDADHDHALSPSEVPPPMWDRLQAADADGNGEVTRDEFDAASIEVRK